MNQLSIIIPMHNEASGLSALFDALLPVLETITKKWEVICVDDGSTDDTLSSLKAYHLQDARIRILSFSRNFGKDVALTAGLEHATGQAVIPMDADLQDPPEIIPQMVERWLAGAKIVNAVRVDRRRDSAFKRFSAGCFYRLMGRIADSPIHHQTGDFRLLDANIVEELKKFPERTRFMKGLFAWVGHTPDIVEYSRTRRDTGISQWSLGKLYRFALDGLFAFSTFPLKIWTYIGLSISFLSLGYASFLVIRTLIDGVDVPGYASIMTSILFMGGVQLISLGVIGEYIARIYKEVKQRPLYIVAERIGFQEKQKTKTEA